MHRDSMTTNPLPQSPPRGQEVLFSTVTDDQTGYQTAAECWPTNLFGLVA